MVIGSYGGVVFVVSGERVLTFNKYKRTVKKNYAEHKIVGGVTKLEAVGVEAEEVTMTVELHSDLGVEITEEVGKLREMCIEGEANYLILNNEVINLYVLSEVSEGVEVFNGDGSVKYETVDLKLKEYIAEGDF